jgi:hypothetical protein
MGTPIDFIYDNDLQWQASLKGDMSVPGRLGYRGALIIVPGKVLSADKQLPPKSTLKQAIALGDSEKLIFLAGELETFDDFEPLIEKYGSILTPETLITLFVIDLDADVKFEYKGLTVYAFALDESSVWNELLDYADLSKGDLKKMGAEEKVDTLYDELKTTTLRAPEKSYEEAKALKSSEGKVLYGAV